MKFYILKNPIRNRALTDFSPIEPHNTGPAPHCHLCGSAMGMLTWLPPYRAEIELLGREAGDMVFGPGNELVVSQDFMRSYKDFGLRGLHDFHPVEVVKIIRKNKHAPREVPPYYCVSISRTSTLIDQETSGLVMKRAWTCDYCRTGLIKSIQKVVIDEDSWTGEDIFYARGLPGTRITSERFKNFVLEADIKNGDLIGADEYHFDFYPHENT
jgi:hypothetical protein